MLRETKWGGKDRTGVSSNPATTPTRRTRFDLDQLGSSQTELAVPLASTGCEHTGGHVSKNDLVSRKDELHTNAGWATQFTMEN
jgi:hypothetical protein